MAPDTTTSLELHIFGKSAFEIKNDKDESTDEIRAENCFLLNQKIKTQSYTSQNCHSSLVSISSSFFLYFLYIAIFLYISDCAIVKLAEIFR